MLDERDFIYVVEIYSASASAKGRERGENARPLRDTVALEQKIEGNAIHSSSTAEFHCFMNAGNLLRVMGNKPTKGFDEVRSDIRMISVYKYFVVLLLAIRSVLYSLCLTTY